MELQISVIIPVYNAAPFVRKAVESALAQPETAEVLLIEDGSRDNSLEICRQLDAEYDKVRLFTHEGNVNLGAGPTRNVGIDNAKFDFIAFLDADDYYLPDRFRAERKIFAEKPDADGVYGALGFEYYSTQAKKLYIDRGYTQLTAISESVPHDELFWSLMGLGTAQGGIHLDALTLRRSAIERADRFSNLTLHQDSEFITKIALTCRLEPGILDEAIGRRGVHDENRIVHNPQNSKSYSHLYKNLILWAEDRKLDDSYISSLRNHYYASRIKSSRRFNAVLLLIYASFRDVDFLRKRVFFFEASKSLVSRPTVIYVKNLVHKPRRIGSRLTGRIRCLFTNLGKLVNYFRREQHHNKSTTRKLIYFDINEPRLERYLYWLMKMFDIAGWNVSLKASPNLLLNLRNFSEYIYDIESLDIRFTKPTRCNLVISNRPIEGAILLDTDYFAKSKVPNSLNLPFFMHPDIYHSKLYDVLHELRKAKNRPLRVFLGGNLGDCYNTLAMTRFGLMNRSEIAAVVKEAFVRSENHLEIANVADAEAILAGEISAETAIMHSPLVPVKTWMGLLAASDFFIASPGIIMPFSHNIIESLAVGTIPITQYGHLFDPPLVDGETCIRFTDAESLRKSISRAMTFDSKEIARLRQNVQHYYHNHLMPEKVVNRITQTDSIDRIYLIAGHSTVSDYEQ